MVEQEKLRGSPALPGRQNSGAKLQDSFNNQWFRIDLNHKVCSSGRVLEESFPYVLDGMLPQEIDDCYQIQSSNPVKRRKLSESSQPASEMLPATSDPYYEANSPLTFWETCPLDWDSMKLDDVFQVDKDELFQSPTLAELNANDESLFDSFDCFDGILPYTTSNKQMSVSDYISAFNKADQPKIASCSDSSISMKEQSFASQDEVLMTSRSHGKQMSCQDSIKEPEPESNLHDKVQTVSTSIDSKKSKKNLKPNPNTDTKVEKETPHREPSVEKCLQPSNEQPSTSHNENSDSDEESEMDTSDGDDYSEDEVKLYSSKNTSVNKGNREKKRLRYFWQYNMQSKGPKGPKLKLAEKSPDVHDVKRVADPIFSKDCPIDGVKHSGKARRGDGNDLTPNAQKLFNIGKELDKLNHEIEGLVPVNELPVNARTKSRKEKNKLASRACRLKKKAQHEANKIKLYGLQEEQKQLLILIKEVKKIVLGNLSNAKNSKHSLAAAVEALEMKRAVSKVAGCSADFVNEVLRKVAAGDKTGGLKLNPVYDD